MKGFYFFSQKIGDYLLTLPQQLEPFITQDNPGLAAAMKAGNLPFPDIQGIVVASSPAVRLAKLALPTKGCSQANLCIVITGLCRIPFSIVLHLRVADVQIVCVHLRACVIVRRYVDVGFNFLVTQLQGDCVSKEFLILWVYKFQFRLKQLISS